MTTFRVKRHGGLPIEFEGRLIAESTSDDGEKMHYQSMRLFRVAGASSRYILERLGETRVPGEIVMRYVDDVKSANEVLRRLQRQRPNGERYLTLVALELLDRAAENDPAFAALTERIA